MFPRSEIKKRAKALFFAQYWPIVWRLMVFVCAIALYRLLTGGSGLLSDAIGGGAALLSLGSLSATVLAASLLFIVLNCGVHLFALRIYRGQPANIKAFVAGFSRFGRVLGGMLWMTLWIFIWSLLFVVGGVVRAYAYRLTPYILMDQPDIPAREALKLSIEMTKGYKWKLFVFDLSFLGWNILNLLTGGVLGIFFLTPYQFTAAAGCYEEINAIYQQSLQQTE